MSAPLLPTDDSERVEPAGDGGAAAAAFFRRALPELPTLSSPMTLTRRRDDDADVDGITLPAALPP
jgi:hypothetical protein